MSKELSLEEIFEQLEAMTEQLEDKEVSLEESFEIYSRGMKMLKRCNDKIDAVEKKMMIIDEDGVKSEF